MIIDDLHKDSLPARVTFVRVNSHKDGRCVSLAGPDGGELIQPA